MLFKYAGGKLEFVEKIDKSVKKETDGFSAMRKFKDMDKYNDFNSSGNNAEATLDTIHQNTITELRVYSASKTGVADKISTISLDGKMVIWNLGVSTAQPAVGLLLARAASANSLLSPPNRVYPRSSLA